MAHEVPPCNRSERTKNERLKTANRGMNIGEKKKKAEEEKKGRSRCAKKQLWQQSLVCRSESKNKERFARFLLNFYSHIYIYIGRVGEGSPETISWQVRLLPRVVAQRGKKAKKPQPS